MAKPEARKLLIEAREELAGHKETAQRLRDELVQLEKRIRELEGAERYLAQLAGEPMPEAEEATSPAPTKRGEMLPTLDAAVTVLRDRQMTTGEIADAIMAAGYYSGPRGKLVSYLGTMLTRDPRVMRVGKGTWRRART